MIATDNPDTNILTITKNGMAKEAVWVQLRKYLTWINGIQKTDSETGELLERTDGYRRTSPGLKVLTQ